MIRLGKKQVVKSMLKSKKEAILIICTSCILLAVAMFSAMNWEVIIHLFQQMLAGITIVKDYVRSLGIVGILAISFIIIVCFFFPVISSLPIQLASAISYGLPFGIVHVVISTFIASQLSFLITRVFHIFQTSKQREKQLRMEKKIKNRRRSMTSFLLLAYVIPFVPLILIHNVLATSGMKWRRYALITLVGPIPSIAITLWLGEKVTTTTSPVVSYVMLFLIITCVALSLIYKEKIIDVIFNPRKDGDA